MFCVGVVAGEGTIKCLTGVKGGFVSAFFIRACLFLFVSKRAPCLVTVIMSNNAVVLPSREAGLTLLEHLHANQSKKCENIGDNSLTLLVIDRTRKKAVYVEMNCKMWSCGSCGARKARLWIARVINGVKYYGGQWYFMTITAHQKWRGEERSLINLRQGWRKLYNRLLRKYGKFHYIKIFEHHVDGTLHLHLLTDVVLPYTTIWSKSKKTGDRIEVHKCKYLKDTSAQCGMGYMCDYQPLENVGLAAWYVAKYLGKSIGSSDFPPNLRRIQASHKFQKLPPVVADEGLSYVLVRNRTDFLLKAYNLLVQEDILVFDSLNMRDITSDDWEKVL